MRDWNQQWKDRDPQCTCEPPHSSKPSVCAVHCLCMEAGRSTYIPMIDGQCRRCRKYPLYDYN